MLLGGMAKELVMRFCGLTKEQVDNLADELA